MLMLMMDRRCGNGIGIEKCKEGNVEGDRVQCPVDYGGHDVCGAAGDEDIVSWSLVACAGIELRPERP